MAARSILRIILGRYLNQAPDLVRFSYQVDGKPILTKTRDLHFNVSHTQDVLVIGVLSDRPLGIDIEHVPSGDIVDQVSPLVFSIPERTALDRLPSTRRCESFARLWTWKEAYIKADGRGMSLDLEYLDVESQPGRVLQLNPASGEWLPCPNWYLRSLPVGAGIAGALAAQGEWRVAWHNFDSAS
jgi:4'-phosphopantetheinyl transferase